MSRSIDHKEMVRVCVSREREISRRRVFVKETAKRYKHVLGSHIEWYDKLTGREIGNRSQMYRYFLVEIH
jgi:hypothetical protein